MQKKIPMRMCVGCREMKPKRELVRIVCSKDGAIAVDETGKAAGRGAYVCPRRECLERAVKSRALERAFSSKVEKAVFDALAARIETLSPAREADAQPETPETPETPEIPGKTEKNGGGGA